MKSLVQMFPTGYNTYTFCCATIKPLYYHQRVCVCVCVYVCVCVWNRQIICTTNVYLSAIEDVMIITMTKTWQ